MTVLLASIGTRGDIEPFLAIGNVLQDHGIQTHCALPAQFETEAMDAGIPFSPLSGRFLQLLESEVARAFMGQSGGLIARIRQITKLIREMNGIQADLIQDQKRIVQNLQPNKILFHPKCLYPLAWGQQYRGDVAMLVPIPGVLHPIEKHPPIIASTRDYGKMLNRLVYRLASFARGIALPKMLRPVAGDLPGINLSARSLLRFMDQEVPAWYSVSQSLFPRPVEWPEHAKIIGYFEREKTTQWEPSTELCNFLERHPKVLFATFGSMTNSEPLAKTEAIIEAANRFDIPLILNTYSGGLAKPPIPSENVFVVQSIPYDWIFPRVYAVLHHGGSGTTHTAIKHGCANLIIPHIVDQFFWNATNAQLGSGPGGIPIKKLNQASLEPLLDSLWNDPSYRKNAETLATKMQNEADASELIEWVGSSRVKS